MRDIRDAQVPGEDENIERQQHPNPRSRPSEYEFEEDEDTVHHVDGDIVPSVVGCIERRWR
jgi:hypothetical protein